MSIQRRRLLQLITGGVALPAISRIARAQAYPTRPVTLVVPIAAGGAVDTTARIIAEKLQDKLRQPFIVENRPGAGATLGTNFVAKARPDGYTLVLMDVSAVWAKLVSRNALFDVTSDFTPIAMVATTPLVLFAHPSLAVSDVKELIAYSKANPGKLSVGTAGVSTPHHLAAAWLNTAAKIDITHVPYRGAALALNDLLSGQIPLIWATPVSVMPFVQEGKAKVLGVATQRRIPMLPQVATIAESAVPGFDVDIWLGIAAPANVPREIVARIGQAIGEITELPDVQSRMSTLGLYVDFRNSEQFRELIVREHQKYGMVIQQAGIQRE